MPFAASCACAYWVFLAYIDRSLACRLLHHVPVLIEWCWHRQITGMPFAAFSFSWVACCWLVYIHCVHHHHSNIACQQGERCSQLWRLIFHLLAVRKFMLVADSKFWVWSGSLFVVCVHFDVAWGQTCIFAFGLFVTMLEWTCHLLNYWMREFELCMAVTCFLRNFGLISSMLSVVFSFFFSFVVVCSSCFSVWIFGSFSSPAVLSDLLPTLPPSPPTKHAHVV